MSTVSSCSVSMKRLSPSSRRSNSALISKFLPGWERKRSFQRLRSISQAAEQDVLAQMGPRTALLEPARRKSADASGKQSRVPSTKKMPSAARLIVACGMRSTDDAGEDRHQDQKQTREHDSPDHRADRSQRAGASGKCPCTRAPAAPAAAPARSSSSNSRTAARCAVVVEPVDLVEHVKADGMRGPQASSRSEQRRRAAGTADRNYADGTT